MGDAAQALEGTFGRTFLTLTKLLLIGVATLHWIACTFYLSAAWGGLGQETWVFQQNLQNASTFDRSVLVHLNVQHAGVTVVPAASVLPSVFGLWPEGYSDQGRALGLSANRVHVL